MSGALDRAIRKELLVRGRLEEVWNAWTTTEGAMRFFAPRAKIELGILCPYEVYFYSDSESPRGSQGSEDCRILSYVPCEMLSFEWSAPPEFPNVRKQKASWIVIQLVRENDGFVRIRLSHLGWEEGDEWNKVHEYFVRAWDVVLGRLEHVLSTGQQIDWETPYRPPKGRTYDVH